MSVKGCFTDFHIDFGGTSVWYHVFKGGKVRSEACLCVVPLLILDTTRVSDSRPTVDHVCICVCVCVRVCARAGDEQS